MVTKMVTKRICHDQLTDKKENITGHFFQLSDVKTVNATLGRKGKIKNFNGYLERLIPMKLSL